MRNTKHMKSLFNPAWPLHTQVLPIVIVGPSMPWGRNKKRGVHLWVVLPQHRQEIREMRHPPKSSQKQLNWARLLNQTQILLLCSLFVQMDERLCVRLCPALERTLNIEYLNTSRMIGSSVLSGGGMKCTGSNDFAACPSDHVLMESPSSCNTDICCVPELLANFFSYVASKP